MARTAGATTVDGTAGVRTGSRRRQGPRQPNVGPAVSANLFAAHRAASLAFAATVGCVAAAASVDVEHEPLKSPRCPAGRGVLPREVR